jgi:hypothetical protein
MTKDKFITQSIRDASGQCQSVHDIVMINLDIDRMGTCSACGHDITHHYGIYGEGIGYMWVGSCCKKILCASDKSQINPDHGTMSKDKFDRDIIFINQNWLKKLGDYIYQTDKKITDKNGLSWIPNFDNNYNGAWYSSHHNDFLQSIYKC